MIEHRIVRNGGMTSLAAIETRDGRIVGIEPLILFGDEDADEVRDQIDRIREGAQKPACRIDGGQITDIPGTEPQVLALDRRIRLIALQVLMAIKLPQPLSAVARHTRDVARLVPGVRTDEAPALGGERGRIEALSKAREGLGELIGALLMGHDVE